MEAIIAKLDAALYPAVCNVNTYLSNYILVFMLVAVGLWYSIQTRLSRSAASARACARCSAT